MLIKSIVKKTGKGARKGDAIPYSPEESLPFAIEYGASLQNTKEKIFWVLRGSVKKESFSSFINPANKSWEATAAGTALVGFTDVRTDEFHKAKPHRFTINYKASADELGLPDVKVVSMKMDPIDMNPQRHMGFQSLKVEQPAPKVAEPVVGPKPVAVAPAAAPAPQAAAAPQPPKEEEAKS